MAEKLIRNTNGERYIFEKEIRIKDKRKKCLEIRK